MSRESQGMGRRSARSAPYAAVLIFVLSAAAGAQQQLPGGKSADWLIHAAVLAAPAPLRDSAEVRGVVAANQLVVLRKGSNGIICLADLAEDESFSAACYHESLEPFMERGRELRRQGIDGMKNSQARWQEIEAGKLHMPAAGMVYNLRLPSKDFDPATIDPATGGRLHAIYMPGATTATTGLPSQPGDGPWLMNPGTPGAHVMISLPAKKQQ